MKVYHYLIFILLIYCTDLRAQVPFFKHYTTEHGLPSMETYQVRQDTKGYIWVATDRGVCRFNGTEFTLFNQKDGLENITIFCLKEDDNNNMWAGSFSGALFYYKNDQFNAYAYNDTLRQIMEGRQIEDLVIEKDTVWLSIANEIVKIHPDGEMKTYVIPRKKTKITYREVASDQYLFHSYPRSGGLCFQLVEQEEIFEFYLPDYYCTYRISKCTMKKLSNGDVIAGYCNDIIIFKKNGEIISLPIDFNVMNSSVLEDENGRVWIGLEKGGVIQLDPANNYKIIDRFLDNYSITFIEKDREGGIWLTTIEQGVIYMPSPTIINFKLESTLNKKYTDLEICQDELYVSSFYGLYKIVPDVDNTWDTSRVLPDAITGKISNTLCFKNTLYVNSDGYSYALSGDEFRPLCFTFGCMVEDSSYFYSIYKNISKVDSTGSIIELGPITKKGSHRVRTAFLDDQQRLWLGRLPGLDVYVNDSIHSLCEVHPIFCHRITQIKGGDFIYISTLGGGILRIDPCTGQLYNLNATNGLPDNNCSAIYPDASGNLWVATSKGFCFLVRQPNNTYTLVKKYTALDGLVQGEVVDILAYKNHIWVLAQNGLSAIPVNHPALHSTPPPIKLSSATLLNGDSLQLDDDTHLTYTQNDILFEFEGISYKNAFKKTYAYRLLGLDSNFAFTRDNSVQYISLQPGEYTFEVKAINGDQVMSHQAATFSLTIVPPLWQKGWFQLVFGILVLMGVILGI